MTKLSDAQRLRYRDFISKYGDNCNTFLSLYEGFDFFDCPEGVVAYFETKGAWVGVGEPLAPREAQVEVFKKFVAAANQAGKVSVCIPVSDDFSARARKASFSRVIIGSEPRWDLERFPKSGQTWLGTVQTAKHLHGKGGRVREFDPKTLTIEKRKELESIVAEWLESRKMTALDFLNKVEPWSLSEDKKYFELSVNERVTAFVAAVPVWPRKGWYLIDVMRRAHTEAGTTELLVLESMRLLREQGAKDISLGIAPLSNLSEAPEDQRGKFYEFFLNLYENADWFYGFKSLHQYKMKFQPTFTNTVYIVFGSPRASVRGLLGVIYAFLPGGLLSAGVSAIWRTVLRFSVRDWIRSQIEPTVIVRSAPMSFSRLLLRCKVTVAMFILNVVLGVVTLAPHLGALSQEMIDKWSFTWEGILTSGIRPILLSGFLHWNVGHLLINLFAMIVFCGGLEYLVGPGLTLCCYMVGLIFANALTGLLVVAPLHLIGPEKWAWAMREPDVGASLGIFVCAGAMLSLLRRGRLLGILMIAGSCILSAVTHSVIGMNHIVALALGILVARVYFRS